jgi:allophanate hydrolase subunit 1
VLFDGVTAPDVLGSALAAWTPTQTAPSGPATVIPVVYDGPDLGFVADAWGVAPEEVGSRLASVELVSAFCGFAPGFAYLAGLPQEWHVPRLGTPRPRVAAG